MSEVKIKRREFVKRAAYAAPVILTLKAMPAFAYFLQLPHLA